MTDFISLITSLFGGFFNFLDNFHIFGSLSLLKILIIVFLFNLSFIFLFHNKRGGK